MANILPKEKQVAAIGALAEGSTGLSQRTLKAYLRGRHSKVGQFGMELLRYSSFTGILKRTGFTPGHTILMIRSIPEGM